MRSPYFFAFMLKAAMALSTKKPYYSVDIDILLSVFHYFAA